MDLQRLREFIADKNPAAARRAANRIKSVSQLLVGQPLIGHPVQTPAGETRQDIRELPLTFGPGGYVIRYQVLPRQVRVLRIWRSREERR